MEASRVSHLSLKLIFQQVSGEKLEKMEKWRVKMTPLI